jgi:hypothetical protein
MPALDSSEPTREMLAAGLLKFPLTLDVLDPASATLQETLARAYRAMWRWRTHDGARAIAPSGADPWRRLVQRSERSGCYGAYRSPALGFCESLDQPRSGGVFVARAYRAMWKVAQS